MASIWVINETDRDVHANLLWAETMVSDAPLPKGEKAELSITGIAAFFGVEIRADNYDRTWLAKRNLVPRNVTLKFFEHNGTYQLGE